MNTLPESTLRYRPPLLPIIASSGGYLTTRIPPHIWLDNVLLALSAVLALAVVVHAVLWFVTWLWLRSRGSSDA